MTRDQQIEDNSFKVIKDRIFIIIIIFARGISKTKGKKYNINLEIPHHKEDYIIIIYAQHFIHPYYQLSQEKGSFCNYKMLIQ